MEKIRKLKDRTTTFVVLSAISLVFFFPSLPAIYVGGLYYVLNHQKFEANEIEFESFWDYNSDGTVFYYVDGHLIEGGKKVRYKLGNNPHKYYEIINKNGNIPVWNIPGDKEVILRENEIFPRNEYILRTIGWTIGALCFPTFLILYFYYRRRLKVIIKSQSIIEKKENE